jgi:ribonuclease HI
MIMFACDGSSLRDFDGNVGKGPIGWSFAREDGYWYANGYHVGTNQRAELLGLIMLLVLNPKDKIHIQLDSKYVLNTAESWMWGWSKNSWVKKDGNPVANLDLVKTLHLLMIERGTNTVNFEWVKGHDKNNSNPLNTVADEKANKTSNVVKNMLKDGTVLPTYFHDSLQQKPSELEHKIYLKHKPVI